MKSASQIMVHKNTNHWMAKLFVQIKDGNTSSYILCRYLLLYENGDFEIIDHAASGLNYSEINIQITRAKQKLVEYVWDELKEKGHWITFRDSITPSDLFEYITLALKIELDSTIRDRTSAKTSQMSFFNYIANSKTQKSIRKALYLSHSKQIRQQRVYNPKSDFIICRSFDDPNLIVAMINCPMKNTLFKDIKEEHAILFFRWLQKFYTPSSIINSITSSVIYCGNFYTPLWVNSIRMVDTITRTAPYAFSKFFQKSHMNKKTLHDELIRINRLSDPSYKTYNYVYSKNQLDIEGNYLYLKFVLPKNTQQLRLWGDKLRNCLFSYNERVYNHESLIIGVFHSDEELTYAIELENGFIIQAYGIFNSKVSQDELNLIYKWIRRYDVKKENR